MAARLDRRTRRDEDRRFITPDAFWAEIFPGLVARHGALAAQGMARLDAPPLIVEVEGAAWTIQRAGDTITVREGGAEGGLRIALDPDQFSDWVQNQIALNGFLTMRALNLLQGTAAEVSIWDALWIALLEGWPVVDDAITFQDRHGAPLDLTRSFTPESC